MRKGRIMYRHFIEQLPHRELAFSVSLVTGVIFGATAFGEEGQRYCVPHTAAVAVDLSTPTINRKAPNDFSFFEKMTNIGVKTIIRYYDRLDETMPGKTLHRDERDAITKNRFSIAVVFQHNNNDYKKFKDLAKGDLDAARALKLAIENAQPKNSAIYFGVDFDPKAGDTKTYDENVKLNLHNVIVYFTKIKELFSKSPYKVGVYGSGFFCEKLIEDHFAELCWLSPSAFLGTAERIEQKQYDLLQKYPPEDCGGKNVDFNIAKEPSAEFGQFSEYLPLAQGEQ